MRTTTSRLWFGVAGTMLALALPVSTAHAGGFEFSGAGTRPLGRGGAFAARADDAMALLYNPAMLADLTDSQIHLSAGLGIMSACVQRTGTYGSSIGGTTAASTIFDSPGSPDAWTASSFPQVCNGGPPQILPQLVANVRLLDNLGLAFGILAPNGVGSSQWGSSNGTVNASNDTTGNSLRPSPTRYALADANLLLFSPSVGFGWRPVDWFRVGLTLQWGIGIVSFSNYTNAGMGGEDPSSDIRTQLSVISPFVPAGILTMHFVPHESIDIVIGGRLSDAVGGAVPASGNLTLTTNPYGNPDPASGSAQPQSTTISGTTLHSAQPWQFWTGVRYGHRLRPRAYTRPGDARLRPGPDDPMADELFDVELDVVYEYNQQVTDFVVTNPPGAMANIRPAGCDGSPSCLVSIPVPSRLPLAHGWSDDLVFRLGGDANVIPGLLALRAGGSFEVPLSRGFVRYMTNDFMQGWRIGLHVGATVRIDNRFDLSIAYAHIWTETIQIGVSPSDTQGNYRQVAATGTMGQCPGPMGNAYDPSNPVSSRGCFPSGFGSVVNNGTYTMGFDVLSLSGTYHFD